MMNVQVNNLPDWALKCQWVVVRVVDGEVWFFDAWAHDRKADALAQAVEEDGFVVENPNWLQG